MSSLAQKALPSTFAARLEPDPRIKTPEVALENEGNIIRKPRVLQHGAFSYSLPEERKEYKFATYSEQALVDLGLDAKDVESDEFKNIVSGSLYQEKSFVDRLPFPYCQAYAGWQFGQFAGQLGDGRVHNLFEVEKPSGNTSPSTQYNRSKYELQLKGSGMNPFSRFADGKAVSRSSVREYIISEHLNSIGIPTTRALALTYLPKTYAQRQGAEKCAIVARFAELWIRLGTFDLYRYRSDSVGVRQLCDYVIDELYVSKDGTAFPYLHELMKVKPGLLHDPSGEVGEFSAYDKMYFEAVLRNATTTAIWQSYGFLNGVLNTDNTSILGLSMDFGPFSIMDRFNPNYTPNSEDHQGRYSYVNTPTSIWWNLTRLGEDLALLIGAEPEDLKQGSNGLLTEATQARFVKRATKIIELAGEAYKYSFTKKYLETFLSRLGLPLRAMDAGNPDLINSTLLMPMLDMLKSVQCDFNKFFLTLQDRGNASHDDIVKSLLLKEVPQFEPYDVKEITAEIKAWLVKYDEYVQNYGFDYKIAARSNPRFLPRNWILDEVIQYTQKSEYDDLSYLKKLEKMAFNPFDPEKWGLELKDVEKKWLLQSDIGEALSMLQCSCSS